MKTRVIAFAPVVLGIALASLWQSGLLINPILFLRVDVGTLILLSGIAASIGIGGAQIARHLARQRSTRTTALIEHAHADSRRRFIRRLDHEIKNPLTAMRAALANLNGRANDPTVLTIRDQVDRLARLSADLRKLADIETEPFDQDRVNIGDLLNELFALEQPRAQIAGCNLVLTLFQTPWPLPPVIGDRDLLYIALHNLIDNAIKFCQRDDQIELRAFEDGAFIAIEVADSGPGIREEELPHIEEELYRGSAARGTEGSGLGLAIVRAIITRHHGALAIRSRVDQGTAVTVRLPIAR
jgi:signal transduction histidine kinase